MNIENRRKYFRTLVLNYVVGGCGLDDLLTEEGVGVVVDECLNINKEAIEGIYVEHVRVAVPEEGDTGYYRVRTKTGLMKSEVKHENIDSAIVELGLITAGVIDFPEHTFNRGFKYQKKRSVVFSDTKHINKIVTDLFRGYRERHLERGIQKLLRSSEYSPDLIQEKREQIHNILKGNVELKNLDDLEFLLTLKNAMINLNSLEEGQQFLSEEELMGIGTSLSI